MEHRPHHAVTSWVRYSTATEYRVVEYLRMPYYFPEPPPVEGHFCKHYEHRWRIHYNGPITYIGDPLVHDLAICLDSDPKRNPFYSSRSFALARIHARRGHGHLKEYHRFLHLFQQNRGIGSHSYRLEQLDRLILITPDYRPVVVTQYTHLPSDPTTFHCFVAPLTPEGARSFARRTQTRWLVRRIRRPNHGAYFTYTMERCEP
jgi:hypothetical protein